jgi:uncharacterized membrane protein YqaE (UPF0057 family)
VIVAVLSLIFYVVDPMLGVVLALVLPSVVVLDTTGDYSEVVIVVILAVALYFVRKVSILDSEV